MNPIEIAAPYTLTGARIFSMAEALQKIGEVPGDIVECGVWRGGNIILARKIAPDRTCWLYDTFDGMTEPGAQDGEKAATKYRVQHADGWCAASLADVKAGFAETGTLDESKLRFVAGDIVKTLKRPENVPEQIALLRLDTDWYASTRVELEVLYPRLSSGGICIIDDYGHWSGCKIAVDEYFGSAVRLFTKIDYSAIMLVKPC